MQIIRLRELCFAPMPEKIVIVGAGQAASQAVDILRRRGFKGSLTLVGEEPWLPYQRPPLSKSFMIGKQDIEAATLRPENFYHDHHIDLLMGERVVAIDRAQRTVSLASGAAISFPSRRA